MLPSISTSKMSFGQRLRRNSLSQFQWSQIFSVEFAKKQRKKLARNNRFLINSDPLCFKVNAELDVKTSLGKIKLYSTKKAIDKNNK